VLIPVFAVGRAQEIMLVIEDAYRKGKLDGAKAYIDGMTNQASAIHTAYPEYLRRTVQRRVLQNDSPFTSDMFQTAEKIDRDEVAKEEKAIILASSGMLTGGPSVHYLHMLAEDPKNTLIFVGWQGEGSPGRKIQGGLKTMPITTSEGKTKELKIRMRVETAEGFSGHSDRMQLTAYIRNLKTKPKRIIVNHGERSNTLEFAKYLGSRFNLTSSAPQNLDSIRLR